MLIQLRPGGEVATPPEPVVKEVSDSGQILINAGPSEAGAHRLETFLRCPQLYAYDKVLGVLPESTRDSLVRGALMHVYLAHHYARKGAAQKGGLLHDGERVTDPDRFYPPSEAIRVAASRLTGGEAAAVPRVMPTVEAVMAEYVAWARTRDTFEVVAVEQQVKTMVGGVWKYTARMDLVIRNPRLDHYYIWDHKGTSSTPQSAIWDYLMSVQVHGLRRFGQSLYGSKLKGLVLNFVGWVAPYKFDRLDANRAPAFSDRMESIIGETETAIRTLTESGRDPWKWPVHPTSCTDRFGGRCAAWDLCALGKPSGL